MNEEEEVKQQLKNSLQRFIEKIAKRTADDKSVTSGYVEAMTAFIYHFTTKCVSRDLIAFRDHANRRTLSEEDAILIARKAPFYDHLREYLRDELGVVTKDDSPKKGRKQKDDSPKKARNSKLDQYKFP